MHMLLDSIVSPFASIAYFITKAKEKRLGYQLKFKNLPNEWVQGKVTYEMDSIWKSEGLDAIGTNYFTLGAIENGISSRFNENSPLYQSWLGGYLVKFNTERKDWGIEDHFGLAIADQKNWLKTYGDNNPHVKVDYDSVKELSKIKISGYKGTLYRGNIVSDTDVGKGGISLYYLFHIIGLTTYFKKSNPMLNLSTNNFLPKWTNNLSLESYQQITLKGYIAIVTITDFVKAVLYVNAAMFKDKTGNTTDNFSKLDRELLDQIQNIEIVETK
jgi:hypothetical protein